MSRWLVVGAIGLGAFGVPLLAKAAFGDDMPVGLWWAYGVAATLSLVALGAGVARTRRLRRRE